MIGECEDSPITVGKLAAIEAIAQDESLDTLAKWDQIGQVLEAPMWTFYNVLFKLGRLEQINVR